MSSAKPEWAGFLADADYQQLVEALKAHLLAMGAHPDHLEQAVMLNRRGWKKLPFDQIMQPHAHILGRTPPRAWLRMLPQLLKGAKLYHDGAPASLPGPPDASFDGSKLEVALFNTSYGDIEIDGYDDAVRLSPMDEMVALVRDTATDRAISCQQAEAWKISPVDLLEAALENVHRKGLLKVDKEAMDGAEDVTCIYPDADSLSAVHALLIDRHPSWTGPHGCLFTITSPWNLCIVPAVDKDMESAWEALEEMAQEEGNEPGGLSVRVYEWQNGEIR